MFKLASSKELTDDLLFSFINKHKTIAKKRFQKLKDAYETEYEIFKMKEKESWKPDNRIAVNFAKYIVDTFNGFFIGNPIKITSKDKKAGEFIEFLDKYNDQDDNNAELSKICSIYGRSYEMYYVDEDSNIGITYLSPMDAFIIYDDSILERPRFFVRTYVDEDKVLRGSISDDKNVRYFKVDKTIVYEDEPKLHGYDGVPATEYVENAERMGIFEPVLSMINAYNKAISEKANDVDYFADAYLKILGAALNEADMQNIRSNRIINFEGLMDGKLVVEFLQKPNGDETQEHLIDRLEKLIFMIAMVANISDEEFGNASGISLKYKLQAMMNLFRTKERKFTSGMNRRYKLIFSNPLSQMKKDAWIGLDYKFTPNIPANLLEESQIATNLNGITSKETQLKVISAVENVQDELERIKKEEDVIGYNTDYPTNRTVSDIDKTGDQE